MIGRVTIVSLVLSFVVLISVTTHLALHPEVGVPAVDLGPSPKVILDNFFNLSTDLGHGGLFTEVYDSTVVKSSQKVVGDYLSFINYYLYHWELTGNASYLEKAEEMAQVVSKFSLGDGGYVFSLNQDWTIPSGASVRGEKLGELISSYVQLYNHTQNQTYLDIAVDAASFLETYHRDLQDGGYYNFIYASNYQPDYGTYRTTCYTWYIAKGYLDLHLTTENNNYLSWGLDLLNETISVAYNPDYGYLYPYLYHTNQPTSRTDYRVHEQVLFARTLHLYRQAVDPEVIAPYNDSFSLVASSQIQKAFDYALQENWQFIHGFYPDGSPELSTFYLSRQIYVYETLLDMVDYGYALDANQSGVLNQSLHTIYEYVGNTSQTFIRSSAYTVVVPWLVAETFHTLLRLTQYPELVDSVNTISVDLLGETTATTDETTTTTTDETTTTTTDETTTTTTSIVNVTTSTDETTENQATEEITTTENNETHTNETSSTDSSQADPPSLTSTTINVAATAVIASIVIVSLKRRKK